MQDHGLFQAICRVNRLDGDDKDYGYIVDYRDLFNSLESAITDYTSWRARWLRRRRHRGASLTALTRPARTSTRRLRRSGRSASRWSRPRTPSSIQQYFCRQGAGRRRAAQGQRTQARGAVQGRRLSCAALLRLLANEMAAAGYSDAEAEAIKDEVAHYAYVRDEVKLGAGEDSTSSSTKPGCAHLLDTYIRPNRRKSSDFKDTGLIQLIVELGAGASTSCPMASRRTRRLSPRRSSTTCARSSSTSVP